MLTTIREIQGISSSVTNLDWPFVDGVSAQKMLGPECKRNSLDCWERALPSTHHRNLRIFAVRTQLLAHSFIFDDEKLPNQQNSNHVVHLLLTLLNNFKTQTIKHCWWPLYLVHVLVRIFTNVIAYKRSTRLLRFICELPCIEVVKKGCFYNVE